MICSNQLTRLMAVTAVLLSVASVALASNPPHLVPEVGTTIVLSVLAILGLAGLRFKLGKLRQ